MTAKPTAEVSNIRGALILWNASKQSFQ